MTLPEPAAVEGATAAGLATRGADVPPGVGGLVADAAAWVAAPCVGTLAALLLLLLFFDVVVAHM